MGRTYSEATRLLELLIHTTAETTLTLGTPAAVPETAMSAYSDDLLRILASLHFTAARSRGPVAPTPRNYTCVCPQGATPHFTPPGNATNCATVADNQYWMPENGTGANSSVAVCPTTSRVESGSILHYGMPSGDDLIQMAKATLGMV